MSTHLLMQALSGNLQRGGVLLLRALIPLWETRSFDVRIWSGSRSTHYQAISLEKLIEKYTESPWNQMLLRPQHFFNECQIHLEASPLSASWCEVAEPAALSSADPAHWNAFNLQRSVRASGAKCYPSYLQMLLSSDVIEGDPLSLISKCIAHLDANALVYGAVDEVATLDTVWCHHMASALDRPLGAIDQNWGRFDGWHMALFGNRNIANGLRHVATELGIPATHDSQESSMALLNLSSCDREEAVASLHRHALLI